MLPLTCGGDKCQVLVCKLVLLLTSGEHTPIFGLIKKQLTPLNQNYLVRGITW
jgi:hypothetical protein